ncbi:MAG: RHS repeat protein [candidate division NC10 bacterium]|nr:RHS repeat protein [candidate division NC10 bacterium]
MGLVLLTAGLTFADDYEAGGFNGATRNYNKPFDAGDPISAANGAYHFTIPLLSLGGPMNLSFELFYRSDMSHVFQSLPSAFWWRPFARAVSGFKFDDIEHATVYLPDGSQVSFKKEALGNWVLTGPTVDTGGFVYTDNIPQIKYQLKETTDYLYLMDPVAEQVYIFWKYRVIGSWSFWRIARIMDRNGNQLAYTYPASWDFKPTRVEDGLGRSLEITYSDLGIIGGTRYLVTVTDQAGRQITLNYETNGADNANETTLRSITDPLTNTTTFQYAGRVLLNNLIASQTMPLGNTPYTQTYALRTFYGNSFPRVTSQTDALGHTTTLTYDSTANRLTVTRPDGATEKYEHYSSHGLPKRITDPTNKTAQFTRDTSQNIDVLTGVTDRMGDTTGFTYQAETGKLASLTNAKGDTLTHTYTAQDQTLTNPINGETVDFTFYNLTRTDYPDGTNEQFTYDAQGNVLSRVDRNGRTWTYTYNSRGQVLTATTPTGGVTTFTYNADATPATRMDSDTGVTTFGYDPFKRPATITRPDASTVQMAYDANDRITSLTDERGHTTTYTYDANGNLVSLTDPAGQVTQFAYDALDRLVQVTDRLGNVTTQTYDALGRLASITDPTAVATTFGYDARNWRRWLNQITRGGQTWQTGYDDEGIVASRTTPLGHTTTRQTDTLGSLTGLTNPLGQTTTFTRDAMSRLTGMTDPLGRTTTLAYDGRGLLTGVTMPVIGTATYQRDGQGLLNQIMDLNGQEWTFTRTVMGRLASLTDPLGNTWGQTYDPRGRLTQTLYPNGSTLTRTYDDASNLTRRLYSDGTDLQYTYDALNRLMTANDLTLTRDDEGRVTNTENPGTSFGATYDEAGRLKTATYNNGTFTVTYTYNATTGRLTQVTDDLTGTQVTFAYDNDFRLTTLTRSNGVTTTLTWDNAARLTRIQDGAFLDLQYTLDAAGQVTQLNMTAPLDPASLLTEQTETFSYDNASQLTTPGYGYDERGRLTASPGETLTWDGASRLTGISGVPLSYNGLGDLVTRASGETTHYYYNDAIRLNPIMAEKNDTSGQFLRYYVWTPGGSLLYMIDAADGNNVYFYHFDRMGSTLALTDATGTVTDAYAYDPYGRLLSHQGSNPQPFTFVGQFGVRQEGTDGTLYHMRARYYDAVTQRFLSRDPIWPQIADARQINPYQYAIGSPVLYIDPTGYDEYHIEDYVDIGLFETPLNVFIERYIKHEFTYEEMLAWRSYFQEQLLRLAEEPEQGVMTLEEEQEREEMKAEEIQGLEVALKHLEELIGEREAERKAGERVKQPTPVKQQPTPVKQQWQVREGRWVDVVRGVWLSGELVGMPPWFVPGGRVGGEADQYWNPQTGRWERNPVGYVWEDWGPASGGRW